MITIYVERRAGRALSTYKIKKLEGVVVLDGGYHVGDILTEPEIQTYRLPRYKIICT